MNKSLVLIAIFFTLSTSLFSQAYKEPNASIDTRVENLLSLMTIEEKVGQMLQVNLTHITANEIQTKLIGSVLSGGGSVPTDNTPRGWADTIDNLQRGAMSTRLGIPIIYGVDAVHGHNNVQNATMFPHNIGLGSANDPDLMRRIGQVVAKEVRATGIHWTFAPAVSVVRNEFWGRTYEGFAEDPSIHEGLTEPYIQGLQGPSMSGTNIVATAKHFIADGGTNNGINMENATITENELRALHLPPFIKAIEAGVGSVMISYNSWNSQRCHGNYYLVTTLLKEELGFQGIVVSDWNAIRDLPGDYRTQVKDSINAGIDMLMTPLREDWQPALSNLISLANSGEINRSRIDDAVRRILTVKFKAGLFDTPYTDRSLASTLGSASHREVAREAVRKSLVLLKNEGILPLSKTATILVTGNSANSMANQCGGWTINWQGMKANQDTQGETILEALRIASSGNISYNTDGYNAENADVAIIVVGETPYAESEGDVESLALSPTDINVINRVEASGTPYVLILISGRPMTMTTQIQNADAFIAAWLPGTEGLGVTDCLFGDYDFTGRLSYSWPRDDSQIPINIHDTNYNPLFEFGAGLSIKQNTALKGDVDESGYLNIVDSLLIAQHYVGLNPQGFITAPQIGDVDCNGATNIVDSLLIAQYYVGLITDLVCK
ncbi:MAG: glycoside hydrolase family 3 C-terminal domain-containing protein [Spirochaetales bacterium]|nr:glycoside hydrolase family 3 C-terminal domain-containing protein [Spirochaetales bacterium]